jgi:hypothetical protein
VEIRDPDDGFQWDSIFTIRLCSIIILIFSKQAPRFFTATPGMEDIPSAQSASAAM